jgi:hypothetical protein
LAHANAIAAVSLVTLFQVYVILFEPGGARETWIGRRRRLIREWLRFDSATTAM